MDTVKIGKYIAGKRKALGMTQAQVQRTGNEVTSPFPSGSGASVCRMFLFIWRCVKSSEYLSMNLLPGKILNLLRCFRSPRKI